MPSLKPIDFADIFGTTLDLLSESIHAAIAAQNWNYSVLAGAERDGIVLDLLQRIETRRLTLVQNEDKSRWERGWGENLEDFKKSGGKLESLLPKYIRPGMPVRLYGEFVQPEDPNFESNWYSIYRAWFVQRHLAGFKNIFEFGSGSGFNVAYVAQQAVDTYQWVTPGEMLDGLGMAETTPGPLIMVTQFVGFLGAWRQPGSMNPLLAATLGGLLTTWVTFVPCFLWIFFGAPFVEALRANRALGAAMGAITAAVVGVILNLAVWFALNVLFSERTPVRFLGATVDLPVLGSVDLASLAFSLAAAVAIFRFKIGMIPVLLTSALAGVVYFLIAGGE